MNFHWELFIDLGIMAAGLLSATFLRTRILFFQKYLIPNALTAGFLLLPVYNFVMPVFGITTDGIGSLVYHLLNISFVAMTLRKSPPSGKKGDMRIFGTSVGVLSQYALQALLGLGVTLIFMKTVLPDIFPSFGLLLPLGFALGPGQAFAIGTGWESFGFEGAVFIGLTFAAIGYLWACFGGVFLINYGIPQRVDGSCRNRCAQYKGSAYGSIRERARTNTRFVSYNRNRSHRLDDLQRGYRSGSYFLSYLFLRLLTFLLSFAGKAGEDLAVNLWGIGFIFAALVSLAVKQLVAKLKIEHTIDNGSMTRISGMSVDIMVTASIAAISLAVVGNSGFRL